MPNPYYVHDCDKCVYLGHFIEEENTDHTVTYDLYFCPSSVGKPTVIARYGNNASDYLSGIYSSLPSLNEAKKRATYRGLFS